MPHRLEPVGEVAGVRFVNDSKATNVAAARRALAAYADEPVHLILGGSLKGEDFAPLAAAVGPNVGLDPPDRRGGAVARGGARARGRVRRRARSTAPWRTRSARRAPGDVVLLSPACASYDQYENFEQRGDEFRRLVAALGERVPGGAGDG